MQILIIRHGDPDNSINSLTPKGWKEARILADRIAKMDIAAFYVSPLGRAQDTASCIFEKMNRTGETLDWMQEFLEPQIIRPDAGERTYVWDWMPEDWTCDERYYHPDQWMNTEIMKDSTTYRDYQHVAEEFDRLLAGHGYEREGRIYRAVRPNRDTIALICHFGVECVMLAHLLGVSPMVLWHGFCAAPTSVTVINSEERRKGIAAFRVASFGDISHLYAADEPPAFHARFCEVYNPETDRENPPE